MEPEKVMVWGEVWRDPAWGSAGVLVTLIATLIAWLALRAAWNRKALIYEIVANVPLLTVRQKAVNGLQLLFNGKAVMDAQLVIVRITNTGRTAIESDHFEQPLSVTFDRGVTVLAADISAASPIDLALQARVQVGASGDNVEVAPLLLNAGDSFECKMVVDCEAAEPRLYGRIVGVRKIGKATRGPRLWTWFSTVLVLVSVTLVAIAPRVVTTRPTVDPSWLRVALGVAMFATMIMLIQGLVRMPRHALRRFRRKN